jgi:hypothetical protein
VANLILARQSCGQRRSRCAWRSARRAEIVAYMLAESGIIAVGGASRHRDVVRPGAMAAIPGPGASAATRRDRRRWPVLVFAAARACGVGSPDSAPPMIATRTDAVLAMRSGSRGVCLALTSRRSALVVIEIAASIVLLVGAALLLAALRR